MEYITHLLANELHQDVEINVSLACNNLKEIPRNFKYNYNCYRSKRFSYLSPWLFNYNQEKMINENKVNLLYGPMLHGGGFYCLKQQSKFNLPFIAHSHGSDVQLVEEIGYGALLKDINKTRIKEVIKRADHLVAVSQINKINMLDLGAEDSNVSVIHNGIDIEKINSIFYEDRRHYFGIDKEDFLIITVGRNKPVKRMTLLFQSLKKLKSYKKIKCICIGPVNDLKELAAHYGILDKIVFTGQIPNRIGIDSHPPYPELINLYRSSDIYISTSYVESFGSSAADALACGIPIIVGKKHGVKDVIKLNRTGFIMEKESPNRLAELILDCYFNREKLNNSTNEIKSSVAHLNWHSTTSSFKRLFKTLV